MTTWFVSDTHFGHAKMLTFEDASGQRIRPFASIEEMDELIVRNWNERVQQSDLVYHLGDVGWSRKTLSSIMPRLKGTKRLILGNHDDIREHRLLDHFQEINLWRRFADENFVITHVPLPLREMERVRFNVHGHIHEKLAETSRHLNICVEQTAYKPISLQELTDWLSSQQGQTA